MKIIEVAAARRSRLVNCADDLLEELDMWLEKPRPWCHFSVDDEDTNASVARDGKYDVYISNAGTNLYMKHEMTGRDLIERIASLVKFHNSTEINCFWYLNNRRN